MLTPCRTLDRSRQIEAEERANAHSEGRGDGDFSDDPEEATANRIQNDQIDFLDDEEARESYRDGDSDDDVFKYGDRDDEEEAIGLNHQPAIR